MIWLPYIGTRTLPIDNDGMPTELADAWWESDCWVFEWLNLRIVFRTGEVRARQRGTV